MSRFKRRLGINLIREIVEQKTARKEVVISNSLNQHTDNTNREGRKEYIVSQPFRKKKKSTKPQAVAFSSQLSIKRCSLTAWIKKQ